MIIDTSALIAIVRDEPDAPRFTAALASANHPAMSAANYVEAAVVVDSTRDPIASRRFDELMAAARIDVVPVTVKHASLARQAYRDFGRGSGSPARLNFGDCFAYALAADRREPLLFKGTDFTHTDLVAVELPVV